MWISRGIWQKALRSNNLRRLVGLFESHVTTLAVSTLDWFDLTPCFKGAPVRAILSQKDSDYLEVPLTQYRADLVHQLHLSDDQVAIPQQVHGSKVELAIGGKIHADTDGLFSNDPNVVLSLQVADCAPVFLYHPPRRYRGLIHAGWRGLATGIIRAGLDFLGANGTHPREVQVAIGPTIEQSCYEVGSEVAMLFTPDVRMPNANGKYQLDLSAAVIRELTTAGIPEGNITGMRICTYCDSRCHSYRRDGERAGRMVAFFYERSC